MTPTPAALDRIKHTRRAAHLRAYLERYKAVGCDNLLDAEVTLDSLHPRVPWRYAATSSYDGRDYWLTSVMNSNGSR